MVYNRVTLEKVPHKRLCFNSNKCMQSTLISRIMKLSPILSSVTKRAHVSILSAPYSIFSFKFIVVFHYNKAVEKPLFRCPCAVMDYALGLRKRRKPEQPYSPLHPPLTFFSTSTPLQLTTMYSPGPRPPWLGLMSVSLLRSSQENSHKK